MEQRLTADGARRLKQIVSRVSLRNFAVPVQLDVLAQSYFGQTCPLLRITLQVPERDTGEMTRTVIDKEFSSTMLVDASDEFVLRCILRYICDAMCHEVKEAFHFDGERTFDPHPTIAKILKEVQ